MPKFDASSIADVEYDLTGIKGTNGKYIQDMGVVPEPSRQLVKDTMKKISQAYNEKVAKDSDEEIGDTPDEVAKAFSQLDDSEAFDKIADTLLEAITTFCQGHPSPESIALLPWPRFMAFFGYIMENMLSPEASSAGTQATQKRLRSV
jgi:type I site-specific restriction-modification system R (restriction) subunit